MDDNQLLIRIDANVISLTKNFEEFKVDTKEQQKRQDAKLSMHDKQFGSMAAIQAAAQAITDVRMTEQDGKIVTGKFWKTLITIVLGLIAIGGGLAAWMKS